MKITMVTIGYFTILAPISYIHMGKPTINLIQVTNHWASKPSNVKSPYTVLCQQLFIDILCNLLTYWIFELLHWNSHDVMHSIVYFTNECQKKLQQVRMMNILNSEIQYVLCLLCCLLLVYGKLIVKLHMHLYYYLTCTEVYYVAHAA